MSPAPVITPGVNNVNRASVTGQSVPTDTGTVFMGAQAAMGRTDQPVKLRSLADYVANFGPRVSYGFGYDAVDALTSEAGGAVIYLQRVVGPAATKDTHNFLDGAAAQSLAVDSIGEGASGLSVAIAAGSTGNVATSFVITVTGTPTGVPLVSPDLTNQTDAINWALTTPLIRVRNLGGANPAVIAATALAGGNDDRANITDVHRSAALAKIGKGLGPGQVIWPGATTEAMYVALANHAYLNTRFALGDLADTASDTTLRAAAATFQADGTLTDPSAVECIMLCADWHIIPGIVANTSRTVPPSVPVAALLTRNDRVSKNPNLAPSGANGRIFYSLGRTQPEWTDAQMMALVLAGVAPFKTVPGLGLELYGARTPANPNSDPVFVMVGASRIRMAIYAKGDAIGLAHQSKQLDGRRLELAAYGGDLAAMLAGYVTLGALFTDASGDPTTAYSVDVGADVNTPDTLAARQMWAALGIRPSPFAETVFLSLAAYPVNQPV